MDTLPLELRKLGLKEKQIQVYLAALELGHSSVQQIAQKAKISRPTAYEIINQLKKQDLISESKQAGKRYFSAQSPDHLLGLLRTQKRELEEKEREFIRIIAELRSRYYTNNQTGIKTFQGEKDVQILMDDFRTTNAKQIYALIGSPKIWPSFKRKQDYSKIKKRLGKITIKELVKQQTKKASPNTQNKTLSLEANLSQNLIIYDKVIILNDKNKGILVDSPIIINLIRSLFKMLWQKHN